jgi:putative SOS response-associated peptidase YedK
VVAEVFELPEVPQIAPRYNIAPTQPGPVVLVTAERPGRQLHMFRWGLIPSWADDPAVGARMINACAESVASKPSFRSAFRKRRCLVVADGFYEWQKLGRRKQPHYIHLEDHKPFAFAGLWDRWERPEADVVESFTIITTGPNELVAHLHDRMPVILHPKDYDFWLDPANQEASMLERLLRPYPAELMSAHPVRPLVNSPAIDVPDCIAPTT